MKIHEYQGAIAREVRRAEAQGPRRSVDDAATAAEELTSRPAATVVVKVIRGRARQGRRREGRQGRRRRARRGAEDSRHAPDHAPDRSGGRVVKPAGRAGSTSSASYVGPSSIVRLARRGHGLRRGRRRNRGDRRALTREDHARAPERAWLVAVPGALAHGSLRGEAAKNAVSLPASSPALEEPDCSLAEINPLIVTKDGKVLALDAKINLTTTPPSATSTRGAARSRRGGVCGDR